MGRFEEVWDRQLRSMRLEIAIESIGELWKQCLPLAHCSWLLKAQNHASDANEELRSSLEWRQAGCGQLFQGHHQGCSGASWSLERQSGKARRGSLLEMVFP